MLKPGDKAPPFELAAAVGDRIERLRLAQLDSDLVVLFFYPRDFSFICPTEILAFQRNHDAFSAASASLLGTSVDSAESHRRWARELGGIGYPLMADEDGALARAYGVFDERKKVALRATFILDHDRTVAFAAACPINVGRSVSEMLRLVQALRSGRLCPAEWKPGEDFGPADLDF